MSFYNAILPADICAIIIVADALSTGVVQATAYGKSLSNVGQSHSQTLPRQ